MKLKLIHKLFIAVVVIGIAFLTIVSTYAEGGSVCRQYFVTECKFYDYRTSECICGEDRFHLNNTMIQERNAMISGQNEILASSPTDYDFGNLTKALNFT